MYNLQVEQAEQYFTHLQVVVLFTQFQVVRLYGIGGARAQPIPSGVGCAN